MYILSLSFYSYGLRKPPIIKLPTSSTQNIGREQSRPWHSEDCQVWNEDKIWAMGRRQESQVAGCPWDEDLAWAIISKLHAKRFVRCQGPSKQLRTTKVPSIPSICVGGFAKDRDRHLQNQFLFLDRLAYPQSPALYCVFSTEKEEENGKVFQKTMCFLPSGACLIKLRH